MHLPKTMLLQQETDDVNKLRQALISILEDFDISISKNAIIFTEREKVNWWKANHHWILTAIGAIISAIIGVLTIAKMIKTW